MPSGKRLTTPGSSGHGSSGHGSSPSRAFVKLRQLRQRIVTGPLSPVERDVGPPYPFPDAIKKLGPNELNRPLPWKELTAEQRAFQADKMAVHAAMVDRMDREIGRVLKQIKDMGAMENTLVFFLSDNGASAEGSLNGLFNENSYLNGVEEKLSDVLTHLDEFGGPGAYNHYAAGWAVAGDTPFT